jgi:hypothetical protein
VTTDKPGSSTDGRTRSMSFEEGSREREPKDGVPTGLGMLGLPDGKEKEKKTKTKDPVAGKRPKLAFSSDRV